MLLLRILYFFFAFFPLAERKRHLLHKVYTENGMTCEQQQWQQNYTMFADQIVVKSVSNNGILLAASMIEMPAYVDVCCVNL